MTNIHKPRYPNIKKAFKPDPGHIICDVDLEQADAQVVAWTSGAKKLQAIFLDPDKNLHDENCNTIFKHYPVNDKDPDRRKAKMGVHATNYGASDYTLARALGITRREAQVFKDIWFSAHPEIWDWQQRVRRNVMESRMVYNQFGYRRFFLGRINDMTVNEALAWEPQSTVGILINKVWDRINTEKPGLVEVLMQVHDSLVLQFRERDLQEALAYIKNCFLVPIPFENNPLIIGTGKPELSRISWGDAKKHEWDTRLVSA